MFAYSQDSGIHREILVDFVNNATTEQEERITAALSTRDADKVRQRRKAKVREEGEGIAARNRKSWNPPT